MIIAMVAISVLVLGLCVYIGIRQIAEQRTPSELRGDWWAGFERDFRAYARQASHQQRARRQQGPANQPPAA